MKTKNKTFGFEGKLVGSVRYCGSGGPYFEAETYQKSDGGYVNVSHEELGDGRFSIKIKEDGHCFVDKTRQIEWGAKP